VKRAAIVVAIALLIAAVSGLDGASLPHDRNGAQPGDAHAQTIAARAGRIGTSRVIRIERTDGTRVDAVLERIEADGLAVQILEKNNRRQETIPFAEIRKIDEVRGHALRNVLIGVGIGVAVLVGPCAAAPSSTATPQRTR
jgi:hypothetical protein